MVASAERPDRLAVGRVLGGFTLIELLLVVLILGISLAVIVPRMGGLLDGGKASVAARVVAQSGRYARTMALLNQLPMELQLDTETPRVRVVAASRDGSAGASTPAGFEAGGTVGFGQAMSRDERLDATRALGVRGNADAAPAAGDVDDEGGGMEAEVTIEKALEGVKLTFEGYLDRTDAVDSSVPAEKSVAVRYRANGTCRPYRVVVTAERTEERFVLDVNAVGTPRLWRDDGSGKEPTP